MGLSIMTTMNTMKKKWDKNEKPVILIMRSKELSKYIQAAARSGGCPTQGR